MSITSRINEMSSHIEQAYDELQGLGADLTNVNKNIENISMVLDDIYDSMPQVSDEGTSLTLDYTRVGKIKSTLKGNTSQDGTPTPTTPIPVNVVSGDNEINVCGKNLFNGIPYQSNSVIQNSGAINYNTNHDVYETIVNSNEDYTISITSTDTSSTRDCRIVAFTSDGTYIQAITTFNIPTNTKVDKTFTTPNGTGLIRYHVQKASTNVMLNNGSTATTYEPYQGNTYNIDLSEGMELCKIGNYQDYFYKDSGKWYLHKEIGKVVLDGSETGWSNPSTNRFNLDDFVTNYKKERSANLSLSNYYESYNQTDANASFNSLVENVNSGFNFGSGSGNNIRIKDSRYTSVDDFKTWVSSNNTSFYYVLATPTTTEITYQPLIDQLNELEKAMSKENQTNISQVNNDLPFIISASALKEWSV